MTTKVKIIIAVLVVAAAAAAYYFLVYKPKKEKQAKEAALKAGAGTPAPKTVPLAVETSPVINLPVTATS